MNYTIKTSKVGVLDASMRSAGFVDMTNMSILLGETEDATLDMNAVHSTYQRNFRDYLQFLTEIKSGKSLEVIITLFKLYQKDIAESGHSHIVDLVNDSFELLDKFEMENPDMPEKDLDVVDDLNKRLSDIVADYRLQFEQISKVKEIVYYLDVEEELSTMQGDICIMVETLQTVKEDLSPSGKDMMVTYIKSACSLLSESSDEFYHKSKELIKGLSYSAERGHVKTKLHDSIQLLTQVGKGQRYKGYMTAHTVTRAPILKIVDLNEYAYEIDLLVQNRFQGIASDDVFDLFLADIKSIITNPIMSASEEEMFMSVREKLVSASAGMYNTVDSARALELYIYIDTILRSYICNESLKVGKVDKPKGLFARLFKTK